jgi:hypothetical protein
MLSSSKPQQILSPVLMVAIGNPRFEAEADAGLWFGSTNQNPKRFFTGAAYRLSYGYSGRTALILV